MNCTISIIVPVYNAEKYLNRCIDSVLTQTYTNFELLLINDGSKDRSGEICDEYAAKDSRVRVFHKENGGVSSARNLGLDNIRGEWVTFCDSDDYVDSCWLNNYILNIVADCELVVQSIKLICNGYTEIAGPEIDISGNGNEIMIALKYDGGTIGYPVNKLILSKIIKDNNIRFREDFRLREDEDFVLRCLLHIQKGRVIYEGGYNYVMPDYWEKYSGIDVFDTEIELYNTAKKISQGKNNNALDKYQVELTMQFMHSLRTRKYHHIVPFFNTLGFRILRPVSLKAILNKFLNFVSKQA